MIHNLSTDLQPPQVPSAPLEDLSVQTQNNQNNNESNPNDETTVQVEPTQNQIDNQIVDKQLQEYAKTLLFCFSILIVIIWLFILHGVERFKWINLAANHYIPAT